MNRTDELYWVDINVHNHRSLETRMLYGIGPWAWILPIHSHRKDLVERRVVRTHIRVPARHQTFAPKRLDYTGTRALVPTFLYLYILNVVYIFTVAAARRSKTRG